MAIEHDNDMKSQPAKITLSAKKPPLISIDALVAVGTVQLKAGDIPRRILRQFYEGIVGLTFVPTDGPDVHFRQLQRHIILEREKTELGRVGFLIKQFDESLLKLRDRGIAYEVLHTDGGLTRMATARDPAGNWVNLIETRAF